MKKRLGILVALCLALFVYFSYSPAQSTFFPRCPFLLLTGWKCAGCGSQRALHCLLHGEVAAAAGYNFLLVASLPYLALLFYAERVRTRRPNLYRRLTRPVVIATCLVVVIGWWVGRNLFGW